MCTALRVHRRSSRYRCQGAPENSASRKIRKGKKEKQKKQKEAGTRIKEALAHLRDRRTLRERERERFSTSVLGKKPFCLGCIIQYSENTDRFCLQKQKCFIIRGLFLSADSKNSDSKSYCKLLLPDIFFLLQLVPKFPAENLKF